MARICRLNSGLTARLTSQKGHFAASCNESGNADAQPSSLPPRRYQPDPTDSLADSVQIERVFAKKGTLNSWIAYPRATPFGNHGATLLPGESTFSLYGK